MKVLNRIVSLIITLLALTVFTVFAIAEETQTYKLTIENTCEDLLSADSSGMGASLLSRNVYSGTFGNQLSGVTKEIYDSMVKNYAADTTH